MSRPAPRWRGVIIVMDSRHPLTEFDWQMLEWTGAQNLPVHLLLTKADKLGRGESMATHQEGARRGRRGSDRPAVLRGSQDRRR